MKHTSLIFVIMLVTTVRSCQECCTWYVVVMPPSTYDTCSCNVTLSQLQSKLPAISTCFGIEIVFQSGIHQVTGKNRHSCQSLPIMNTNDVIIRGQSNVTINCLHNMAFYLMNVYSLQIQNLHFQNCACFASRKPGVIFNTANISKATVMIEDTKFTSSQFGLFYEDRSSIDFEGPIMNVYVTIIISNAVFENTVCNRYDYPLISMWQSDPYGFLNLILNSVNVRNNSCIFIGLIPLHDDVSSNVTLRLTGYNYFTDNVRPSFALIGPVCKLQFSNTKVYFINNTNDDIRAPIIIVSSTVQFENCHAVFSNNYGGVIEAIHGSKLIFNDNTTIIFSNNIGKKAGAIFLHSCSIIMNATRSSISLYFINNTAHNKGGAIYVKTQVTITISFSIQNPGIVVIGQVEIKSVFDVQCNTSLVKLIFKSNSALQGGNHIYGGWVDWFIKDDNTIYNHNTMDEILIIEGNSSSDIASDPVRICMCKDNRPICNITYHAMEIYGYVAHLDLVAVGQRYTPVSGYVEVLGGKNYIRLNNNISPTVVPLLDKCTSITYKIYSDNIEVFQFQPNYQFSENYSRIDIKNKFDSANGKTKLLFQHLSIQFKTKNCPLGLSLHEINRNCICQKRLLMLGLTCDSYSSKVHRSRQQWVGITHGHTASDYEEADVIVHQHCPFDYCRTDNESLWLHLEDEYGICAFNRSGILCGGCKTNFSRVFESSRCKICSNHFLMLVPLWLLSGIVLVIFLMKLDFTVSTAAINGLIFYANIIRTQRSTYFTSSASNSFLSKFIAWLNFDCGVELCLYNGLDTYVIMWLQFSFILYIWILTAVMIILSHYSIRIPRVIGNNAVSVIATLFLFSYTKLLQLIIDVFSFTVIIYPDGYKSTVWLLDGNVEFLGKNHILLFLLSLILVLCLLMYTLMLLTVQFHEKISQYHFMSWVNKLKPLFDAYTRLYVEKHRYWTGLLLVARIVLALNFTLNRSNNPATDHLAIASVSSTLMLWLYFTGWVYNSTLNNYLELFFLSNLLLISTSVLFELSNNHHFPSIIYTSTGMTFVIFAGLVFYHTLRQLAATRAGIKLRNYFRVVIAKRKLSDATDVVQFVQTVENPCSTVVDLSKLIHDDQGDENCHDDKNV